MSCEVGTVFSDSRGSAQSVPLLEPLCGYSLIRASKLGSGRSDLLDTNFLRQVGHSLLLQRQEGQKFSNIY